MKSKPPGLKVLSVVLALSALAIAQTFSPVEKPSSAATWTPSRTADGQPDLTGIWSNATNKPFERPKELGAKEFYTPEEAGQLGEEGLSRRTQPAARGALRLQPIWDGRDAGALRPESSHLADCRS